MFPHVVATAQESDKLSGIESSPTKLEVLGFVPNKYFINYIKMLRPHNWAWIVNTVSEPERKGGKSGPMKSKSVQNLLVENKSSTGWLVDTTWGNSLAKKYSIFCKCLGSLKNVEPFKFEWLWTKLDRIEPKLEMIRCQI